MSSLILKRQWSFRKSKERRVADLARKCSIPHSIAAILFNRGLQDRDTIHSHLTPSLVSLNTPDQMKDMEIAVTRLVKAVEKREKIGVFGDYDADGVTATATLLLFLQEIGLETSHYIPHRIEDGYGLNISGLKQLKNEGCSLVITVDCGINSISEAKAAREMALDLIITDHHEPGGERPPALAVINPKQHDCPFPFKELAGAGIAFYLAWALRSRLYKAGHWSSSTPPNLKEYLDLIAIGTISDIVPLFQENRILVKTGMQVINSGKRPGIKALMEIARLRRCSSSQDIAFRLGPRINAAGRMGSASTALKLLTCQDGGEAARLARELDELNQKRQSQERRILKDAMKQVQEMGSSAGYVLWNPEWHQGIVGIVASKVVDQVSRPVILLGADNDMATGSGRSPEGFDLVSLLACCRKYLERFGGHKQAAGLSLPVESIEPFTAAFIQAAREQVTDFQTEPCLEIDWMCQLHELARPEYAGFLEALEPFGAGYPEPVLASRDFSVFGSKIVGSGHLRIDLLPLPDNGNTAQNLPLLGWNHGDKKNLPWDQMEIAFTPEINSWQGRKTVQLILKDARERITTGAQQHPDKADS